MSGDKNAERSRITKIYNVSFESMEVFKYLGTTSTNKNSIHVEIKNKLKSGNACYNSEHSHLSSSLLSKNIKIEIHRTIIFPVCFVWV